VFVSYQTPNYRSEDVYPLTVLSNVLSSGKSSRLYRSLVYDQQIALDAGGHYEGLTTDPELFYLYATSRPGKTPEETEKALRAEVGRLQSAPISAKELEKAKNQIEAAFILGSDSNFFLAMRIGEAETVGAGHAYVTRFVENIRKVTAADVTRVAKKYLTDDVKSVGVLVPSAPPQSGDGSGPKGAK
jgi:zinc protease